MSDEKETSRTWILVLNFQGREHILTCLTSIQDLEAPVGGVECVVIDNCSTDGSLDMVREEFPALRVIEAQRNLGFAGGNNLGIRHAIEAGAEYVILFNMDARVDRRCAARLVEVADHHDDAALVGARIFDGEGSVVEFDGLQFDPVLTAGGYLNQPLGKSEPKVVDAAYACGAGVLMRLEALQHTGLFDETYFAYHEDVELSLRCQLCGYRVLNVADAILYHAVGGAGAGPGFRDFMGTRNLVLTLLKLYDRAAWRKNRIPLLYHFLDEQHPERVRAALSSLFFAPTALERRRVLRKKVEMSYSAWLDAYLDEDDLDK